MAPKTHRVVDIAVELDRETLSRLSEMPELRSCGLDPADDLPPAGLKVANAKWIG